MTGIVVAGGGKTPPANGSKSGEGYDRCPSDGCLEVEHSFKRGGKSPKGEGYYNWFMYNADRKAGGCGASWTRTTKQGTEQDRARGLDPKWQTRSSGRNAYVSVPSDAYRDNYDRIFRKGRADDPQPA